MIFKVPNWNNSYKFLHLGNSHLEFRLVPMFRFLLEDKQRLSLGEFVITLLDLSFRLVSIWKSMFWTNKGCILHWTSIECGTAKFWFLLCRNQAKLGKIRQLADFRKLWCESHSPGASRIQAQSDLRCDPHCSLLKTIWCESHPVDASRINCCRPIQIRPNKLQVRSNAYIKRS